MSRKKEDLPLIFETCIQTNMQMDRDVSLANRASLYLINHVQTFTHTTKKNCFRYLITLILSTIHHVIIFYVIKKSVLFINNSYKTNILP